MIDIASDYLWERYVELAAYSYPYILLSADLPSLVEAELRAIKDDVSLRLGSPTREGGDIAVYRDAFGNRSLFLDGDAGNLFIMGDNPLIYVTTGSPPAPTCYAKIGITGIEITVGYPWVDYALLSAVVDGDALRLGYANLCEGGNISVYRDALGNKQFFLDADALENATALTLFGRLQVGSTKPIQLQGDLGKILAHQGYFQPTSDIPALILKYGFTGGISYETDFGPGFSWGDWTILDGSWEIVTETLHPYASGENNIDQNGSYSDFIFQFRVKRVAGNEVCARFRSNGTLTGTYLWQFGAPYWDWFRVLNWTTGWTAEVYYFLDWNVWYWVKIQMTGANIKVKVWEYGQAEPPTWTLEATDPNPLDPTLGYDACGFRQWAANEWTVYYDDVTIITTVITSNLFTFYDRDGSLTCWLEPSGLLQASKVKLHGNELFFGADVNLYRSAANFLVTDDSFRALSLTLGPDIQTSALTGPRTQNMQLLAPSDGVTARSIDFYTNQSITVGLPDPRLRLRLNAGAAQGWAGITSFEQLNASADGLVTKVKAGTVSDADFNLDTDGLIAIDSFNGRIYFRYGGAWHYVNQTAGLSFPERECAICGEPFKLKEEVSFIIDGFASDGAPHTLPVHRKCANIAG